MENESVWKSEDTQWGWGVLVPFVIYGVLAAIGYQFSGFHSELLFCCLFMLFTFALMFMAIYIHDLTIGSIREIKINWSNKEISVKRKPLYRLSKFETYWPGDLRGIHLNTYDDEIHIKFLNGEKISLQRSFTCNESRTAKEFALKIADDFNLPLIKFKEYHDGGGGGG